MNKFCVLDSSALLALIQNEEGSDVIRPLLSSSLMSSINVAEVLTVLQRAGLGAKEAFEDVAPLIKKIIDFDTEQAIEVANLYPNVKKHGLSLGDRACLSLGIIHNIPIYTADKAWSKLSLPVSVIMVR